MGANCSLYHNPLSFKALHEGSHRDKFTSPPPGEPPGPDGSLSR